MGALNRWIDVVSIKQQHKTKSRKVTFKNRKITIK